MSEEKIRKDMTIEEAVKNFPQIIPVFLNYGLHCIGCHVANWETIEQGAMTHGIPNLDDMMRDLNNAVVEAGN